MTHNAAQIHHALAHPDVLTHVPRTALAPQVLGMYPGDAGSPGSDCAGIVVRGMLAGGSGYSAGTPVFGLATGCLATHVFSDAHTMVPMPANTSFEDAAAAPTIQVRAG